MCSPFVSEKWIVSSRLHSSTLYLPSDKQASNVDNHFAHWEAMSAVTSANT